MTVAGVAVGPVLLKAPPPVAIDHAPVDAPPPTLAPLNVSATGLPDWQTVFGPPAVAVATGLTVTDALALLLQLVPLESTPGEIVTFKRAGDVVPAVQVMLLVFAPSVIVPAVL